MRTLINTLNYLCKKYQLHINIKDFTHLIFKTPPLSLLSNDFYFHTNAYCMTVKSNKDAYKHCVEISHSQLKSKISQDPGSHEGFFGVCHAGVKEYVIPIFYKSILVGAMMAGPFACDKDRAESSFKKLHDKYALDTKTLRAKYHKNILPNKIDMEVFTCELRLCVLYLQNIIEQHVNPDVLAAFLEQHTLKSHKSQMIDRALEYIASHLHEKITIQDIATHCLCSKSTLSHAFKELMGVSIVDYIVNERVLNAQKLLRETTMPISAISEMCGFSSSIYFTNTFKKKTNTTPYNYRKKYIRHT